MSKSKLISGLAFLALAGCVSEPQFKPRADVPYIETKEGYFTENGTRYFGKDGKRYYPWIDKSSGERKESLMNFDGKEFYIFQSQGVL